MPGVPSVAEAGVPELESMGSYTIFGLMGPAGIPATVVRRLNEAFNSVSAMPEVDQRIRETLQMRPKAISPEEFRQVLELEVGKWRGLSRTVKIGNS